MKELIQIQQELKAPKWQYNSFWKYHYRSCEDIVEAVKPLLAQKNCVLVISDEIVDVWWRIYVKATATLKSEWWEISVSAYAREEESKKWMDSAQLTWSTSSYARKYALNGLFCIDDTKDSDSTNTHGKEEKKTTSEEKTGDDKQRFNDTNFDNFKNAIMEWKVSYENSGEALKEIYKKYKVSKKMQEQVKTLFNS